jgi:RNA polymerase sigma factor (sigma-70 family)
MIVGNEAFNEQQIVDRIRQRDAKAFAALVKQYKKLVFHIVQRLVSDADDMEDICQEVFIKVFRQINRFTFESRLSTWIARIAYSTAVDYLRKYRKKNMMYEAQEHDLQDTGDLSPEELLVQTDVSGYVRKLVDQLPEQYRLILTLYHLDEFSYEEIKQITGLPEGTVKSYLFRSRKLLKEKLVSYLKQDKQ